MANANRSRCLARYLEADYPEIDYITGCDVVWSSPPPPSNHADASRRRTMAEEEVEVDYLPSPRIFVILNASPVDPGGRDLRLQAISESWAVALRKITGIYLRCVHCPGYFPWYWYSSNTLVLPM